MEKFVLRANVEERDLAEKWHVRNRGWIPSGWAILIKHFIPQAIVVLFANLCNDKTLGKYGGYPFLPYQLLGIMCIAFVGFLLVGGIVFPRMYAAVQNPEYPESKVASLQDLEDSEVLKATYLESQVVSALEKGSKVASFELEGGEELEAKDAEPQVVAANESCDPTSESIQA